MAPGILGACILNLFKAQMDKCFNTEQLAFCWEISLA
jgi:hypothetical protein